MFRWTWALFVTTVLIAHLSPCGTYGCTLMAGAGEVAGSRVVIAKTRDRRVRFRQIVRDVRPARGLRYIGIANEENGRITSGINERGLAVVSAAVSTRREKAMVRLEPVLESADSVDAAVVWLERNRDRKTTWFLLLGDEKGFALLESAPGRPIAVHRATGGVVVHTNHYLDPDLVGFNQKPPGGSSLARLARVELLMADLARRRAVDAEALKAICSDHAGGPSERSLCRHPEVDRKTGGTISAAVYQLEKGHKPRIFLSLGQPCVSRFLEVSFDRPLPRELVSGRAWRINELRRSLAAPPHPTSRTLWPVARPSLSVGEPRPKAYRPSSPGRRSIPGP